MRRVEQLTLLLEEREEFADRSGRRMQLSPVRRAWADALLGELRRRPRGLPVWAVRLYLSPSRGWTRAVVERAVDDLVLMGRVRVEVRGGVPVAVTE